jgi:hypothetical protein
MNRKGILLHVWSGLETSIIPSLFNGSRIPIRHAGVALHPWQTCWPASLDGGDDIARNTGYQSAAEALDER